MSFNAYMHERNIYRNQPDFAKIAIDFPEFRKYAIPDAKGQKVRVDFSNTEALRILTKILLKKDFNLDVEIPEGFLIPTVPQRLNYILWIEDLLKNMAPKKECVSGIDIGTGPCAIFSILGAQKNGWKFIATESSDDAILWAKKNIEKNDLLDKIRVVKVNQTSTLDEVLSSDQICYDFCMCNPPFFENIEEIRKKHQNSTETIADVAQKEEIFVKGGELDFVKNILNDSLKYKDRVCVFSSMFGKKKNFFQILKEIAEIKEAKFTKTEFCQGNTIRWGIAWTFNKSIEFQQEVKKRIKPKKAKPPLEYQIQLKGSKNSLNTIVKQTTSFLKNLEIHFTHVRVSQNFTELLLKSDKNTWTHQRRKRREFERQKKGGTCTEQTSIAVSSSESTQASSNNIDSKVNLFATISSEKHNSDLKSNHMLETSHILVKTEPLQEDSSMDTQPTNSECEKINTSVALENISIKSESLSSDSSELQSNKRKRHVSSEDSPNYKRAKTDADEKAEPLDQCAGTFSDNQISTHCVKTEMQSEPSKIDTQNVSSEKHIQSQIIPSKNKSVKLESESCEPDFCNFNEVPGYNPSSSAGENDCPSKDDSGKILPVKSEICSMREDKVTDDKKAEVYTKTVSEIAAHDEKPGDISSVEGSVLFCHLQFIQGKSKIYVKMNCPPTADRNTMYQVFQLIKNKIN